MITLFLATGLEKVGEGGGDESETITVREIALHKVHDWLETRRAEGALIDLKIYMGLYYLSRMRT